MKTVQKISRTGNPVEFGLALATGVGLFAMISALGWGVVAGVNADSNAVGMLFIVGLLTFIAGAIGWFAVAQPQKHFDDINVPMDTGHHSTDDHAIVPHETPDVTVSQHH